MAQANFMVGAIAENTQNILSIIEKNQENHDIILFPELALTGYPPEDLLFRHDFYTTVNQSLKKIQDTVKNCYVIVGHPSKEGKDCYNSASIFYQGQQLDIYHKQRLPNSGVFDEKRYFSPGLAKPCVFSINGYKFGLCICEDIWDTGPVEAVKNAGATVLLCINASPFDYEKYDLREELLRKHAKTGLSIVYLNQFGGQDELVFDGLSVAMNSQGEVCARARAFDRELMTVTLEGDTIVGNIAPMPKPIALIYQALICGVRDYVNKNRFPGVLLGLSGGIDSALTMAIAVDALGASFVQAVMMPSRYSSDMSYQDAKAQAEIMGVHYTMLSIEPAFEALLQTLSPEFEGLKADTTEENLQARIRGILLMALSNKQGKMVLTTSNKSETAVGYATLYGDMVGGYAPLKDVLKTQVYDLARYRNSISHVIPENVLTRPPSAELKPNQKDQDLLPAYSILDEIIKGFMENNESPEEIIAKGFDPETVSMVNQLIIRNEYKRRQAAPGIKISPRAFGRDWRLPITRGQW